MAKTWEVKIDLTDAGKKADLKGAFVIDASPSAGVAPTIAVNYLIEDLKPVKIAEVRSPHFPHISLVSSGIASPPKIELYLHDTGEVKLVLISRNFLVESVEGSYAIADQLHRFLVDRGAVNYYLLTGLKITGERGVYVASSNPDNVRKFIESGARLLRQIESIPADKLSSYLLFFYSQRKGSAWLLITEVVPYFPDPVAAKELLEVLSKALGFKVDFGKLEEEIEKQREMLKEFQEDYEKMLQEKMRSDREPLYIG
ncbi:MAG: proteasome assembly chaperone family protein [Thaumarchaeota archaeon]|nr:proteasome assembly chaperone family protein [Nitrososphaerota archaeon]